MDYCDSCHRARVEGKGEKWSYIQPSKSSPFAPFQLRCPDCTPRPRATTTPQNQTDRATQEA